MMKTKHLTYAFALIGFLSAKEALALQGGEDPATLPVLIDKRFSGDGRHLVSVMGSTGLATKFIEATGFYLAYDYNFSDLFALEVGGGYFFGSESDITARVRQETSRDPSLANPLSDLHQLQWMVNANLMFTPLYGKMSFASEVDPSYDLFLTVGGGAAGLRRQQGTDDVRTFESKVGAVINAGVGLRFYITRMIAIRFEFRNFFYPDPDSTPNAKITDTDPLTFNLHVQGGLQFRFGGDE